MFLIGLLAFGLACVCGVAPGQTIKQLASLLGPFALTKLLIYARVGDYRRKAEHCNLIY